MGDWLTGLVQGFSQRKGEIENFNLQQGLAAKEREGKIFEHLLASPDPEIRAMAATGMLDSTQPAKRKSGLAGWMGQVEGSPMYGRIKELMNTPVATQVTKQTGDSLPSTQFASGSPAPSVQSSMTEPPGSAGMPTTSPITGGPPPTPTAYTSSPPRPQFSTTTEMQPRKVFLSPTEQYQQNAIAKAGADIEGDIAAYTPYLGRQGAIDRVLMERSLKHGAGVAGQSYAEGNIIQDANSPTGWSQQLYLRADPTKITTIPAQAPNTPEEAAKRRSAVVTAGGQAAAGIPLSASQRFEGTNKLATEWQKINGSYREMQRQYELMKTGLQRFQEGDKIGGSQAVLVTFQKILDPASVVRESEYARSPEGLSLIARIEGFMERLKQGGAGVPVEELAQMTETARQFTEQMATWNSAEQARILKQARDYQIDPSHIFGTLNTGTGAPPAPGSSAAPATPTGPPAPTAFSPENFKPGRTGAPTAPAATPQAAPKMHKDAAGRWQITY